MKRIFDSSMCLALLLCLTAVSPVAAQVVPSPAQSKQNQSKPKPIPGQPQFQEDIPEHKISKAEAQELFRSVDEILRFVSQDTGLPIKSKVKRKLASRDEVFAYLQKRMKEDPDAERLDRSELTLKKLGLIPKTFDLRSFMLGVLKEQVAGFYDAKTKTVYLLDWVQPEAQKPVLAHELTHALQDQNFGVDTWSGVNEKKKLSDQEEIERDEQRTARSAIVEGQAMVTLLDYMLQPLGRSVSDSPELVDAMKSDMVSGGSTPMYSVAPIYLRESLIFPYSYGLDFVRKVMVAKGKDAAFAGVFRDPPYDSRQIMEPQTYLTGERVQQLQLTDLGKIVGKNFERSDVGGLGELDIRIMAKQWTGEPDALALAAAWRGGYYEAFQNKDKPTSTVRIALVTRWSSNMAAEQFARVYREGLKQRYKSIIAESNSISTEDGLVDIRVKGNLVTATEGFSAEVASGLHSAMIESVH